MTSSYLLFLLSEQLFGVKLVGAIEILPWRLSRYVPRSYSYVEGLLDYRGIMYPVYNVAKRLGVAHQELHTAAAERESAFKEKSIILLEESKRPFGIVVDGVAKMIALEEQLATPENPQGIDARYIKGLVRDEDQEVLILDFERLFHAD